MTEKQGIDRQDYRGSRKQQKTYAWEDENLGIDNLDVCAGVQMATKFERKGGNGLWIVEGIQLQLKETDDLNIGRQKFLFYNGFKTALDNLLTEIFFRADSRILLIHGVPQVGKSSLAKCLAYYLALASRTAVYVKMHCTSDLDICDATENLSSYFDKGRWVILDQCNTKCIDLAFLEHELSHGNDEPRIPIVIFTAGHYPPQHNWTSSRNVNFKVISLSVDEAMVDTMKVRSKVPMTRVKSKDILKVTCMYWHVCQILSYCNSTEQEITKDVMEEVIYQISSLDYDGILKFFMVVWPEFFKAKPGDIVAKTKPEDWQLRPDQIQYLGFLLTGHKNSQICNINDTLLVSISGTEADDDMAKEGYHQYKSYYYYFPYLERLHGILIKSHQNTTPQKLYDVSLNIFNKLSVLKGSNVQSLKREIFKNTVNYCCACGSRGLFIHGTKPVFTKVDTICEASSVMNLIELVEENLLKDETVDDLWCVLNVDSELPVLGYDFAYVQKRKFCSTPESKLSMFQLLHVSANPLMDDSKKMLEVYDVVKGRFGPVVEPFFIVPKKTVVGKDFVCLRGVPALVAYVQF